MFSLTTTNFRHLTWPPSNFFASSPRSYSGPVVGCLKASFFQMTLSKRFPDVHKIPTLVYLQNVCEYAKVRSVANTTCLSVFFVISSFEQTFRPQQFQISPNLLWEQTTSSCPWFDLHRKLCGQTSTWSWNNVWVCVLNFTEQIHNVLTKTPAKHNLFKKILQHLVINISQPTLLSGKVYLFSLFIKRAPLHPWKVYLPNTYHKNQA